LNNKSKYSLYSLAAILTFVSYGWVGYQLTAAGSLPYFTNFCLFKKVTTLPCPACGTTRGIVHIAEGRVQAGLYTNPFSLLAVVIMLVVPVWLVYDFITRKSSFYKTYQQIETFIKSKRWVYLSLIAFVLSNWVWNITKEL